jgi:hypothetical protein
MSILSADFRGVHKREEAQGPHWHVAMQPGKRRQLDPGRKWACLLKQAEHLKVSIRAKVEDPFHVIKNLFRHKKVRYKAWTRTRRSCSACSVWPTWSSPRDGCWRSMPEVRLERPKRPRKRLQAHACGIA